MPLEDGVAVADDDHSVQPAGRGRASRVGLIVGGAVVVSVAAVAALGGFADVPVDEQPVFSLGETYRNDLYSITVDDVEVTGSDPVTGVALDVPMVVAEAELVFAGTEPPTRAVDWLRPLDVTLAEDFVGMRSVRDGSAYPPIQPGLPVSVFYTWTLPDDTDLRPGDPVDLGIYVRYVDTDSPLEGVTSRPTLVGIVETAASR